MNAELQSTLKNSFVELYPSEAVRVLEDLDNDDFLNEIVQLPPESVLTVLDRLSPFRAVIVFERLAYGMQYAVLQQAPPRLAIKLLLSLLEEEREQLLDEMTVEVSRELRRLLTFPEDSVASIMDPAIGSIRIDLTVRSALVQIRLQSKFGQSIVFVVDEDNVLCGKVFMQDLAFADSEDLLQPHVKHIEWTVNVSESAASLAELLSQTTDDTVPVVDEQFRLLGVVRHDTLRDVVETDATADLQRMVSGTAEERALSSKRKAVQNRLPWLCINLLTTFLAASVVAVFEGLIAQFTALAVLLPIVSGQSGNSGSQAMAVAIRGLALREIGLRQWPQLAWKELLVGVGNGIVIALICGLAVFVWSGSYGLALIISVAMSMAMGMAGISGALVPVFLTRIGQDPATGSSIILTTITDVIGFFSFLGVASALSFLI